MIRHRFIAFLVFAIGGPALPLHAPAAERIISSVSNHQVLINSNFTGADIVLFGTIEQEGNSPPRTDGYDLVATVTGPKESFVTRSKERKFGIWVNTSSRDFIGVPSYLAVFSTRPFDQFTSAETQRRLQLGLHRTLLTQRIGPDFADTVRDDPFRMAFLRLMQERKFYVEQSSGVTMLTPTLFRATVPLPAEVPVGDYNIDLRLFAGGTAIARSNSAFQVVKVGFEQFVVSSAQRNGVLYGLATVGIALMTGWIASIMFRRD
jgi:uncharacterized protein (TIGR02186 family)